MKPAHEQDETRSKGRWLNHWKWWAFKKPGNGQNSKEVEKGKETLNLQVNTPVCSY